MNRHVPPEDLDKPEADSRFTSRAQPDFKAAARHSARVRWVKRLLPAGILVAALAIGASAVLSQLKLDVALPVDLGRLSLSGSQLTMQMPHLSGFTDDGRAYSVNAKLASQDLKRPDMLYLSVIEARMDLADKKWAEVEARKGAVNIKSQVINLTEGIKVAMDGGYKGTLKDATIDVKKGSLNTKKPVVFTLHDSKIVSDSLTVTESGDKAVFNGNVQVDFLPAQLRSATAARDGNSPPAANGTTPAQAPAVADPQTAPPPSPPEAPAAPPAPGQGAAVQPPMTIQPQSAPQQSAALVAAPAAQDGVQATQPAPPASSPPAEADINDAPEGPVPTAQVPLPMRKPVIQMTALPTAFAPLPTPRPGSLR